MAFTFLYVTAPDEQEATKIAKHLLHKRLIACANIFPIKSIYWWKGKIEERAEVVLLLKTLREKAPLVRKEIEAMHSYDVPCITEIQVKPNEKYAGWMGGEIR